MADRQRIDDLPVRDGPGVWENKQPAIRLLGIRRNSALKLTLNVDGSHGHAERRRNLLGGLQELSVCRRIRTEQRTGVLQVRCYVFQNLQPFASDSRLEVL